LIKRKEKALEGFQRLFQNQGPGEVWDESELKALSQALQKLYAGALSSAHFADLRARLSGNMARLLGHQPPSVTYNQEGSKVKKAEPTSRIDRTH
jgi:hypothetical protein